MKRILLIIITCAILLVMTGCSPDPRVAPFKAWIVGVDAPTVLYDEDYGTRILIMQKGEDADVEIIHNREPNHKVTISAPSSDEHYVATVSNLNGMKFRIHAEDEGCARVVANIQGEKVQYLYGDNRAETYVYVVVEGEEGGGITVNLSEVNGSLNTGGVGATLHLGDTMTFTYDDTSNINVDHVDWYVNGVKVGSGTSFVYEALTVGQHNVRCIIYGWRHGEWKLGHSNELKVDVGM